MSQHDNKSLLKDLEDIRQSLDRIAKSESAIPLLEEIVDKREPTHVNPNNPFLSSRSLSELIRIRNEAEVKAAEELADMKPSVTVREHRSPQIPVAPDPDIIRGQLESVFESWIDEAVENYLQLFEQELRYRLRQDYRKLVTQWFQESGLPVPDTFTDPSSPSTSGSER